MHQSEKDRKAENILWSFIEEEESHQLWKSPVTEHQKLPLFDIYLFINFELLSPSCFHSPLWDWYIINAHLVPVSWSPIFNYVASHSQQSLLMSYKPVFDFIKFLIALVLLFLLIDLILCTCMVHSFHILVVVDMKVFQLALSLISLGYFVLR